MAAPEGQIIIKRVKKAGHEAHHGGQWKVAYADFVTAMMAFFLLMWLINTTSPEQKRGIADYFAPASVSQTTSGSGGILGGASLSSTGTNASGSKDVIQALAPEAPPNVTETGQTQSQSNQQSSESAAQKAEDSTFASAAQSLRQAMQDMPELAELSKQIIVDKTPEGLRIQLVDQEGRSMFQEGSAVPNDRAKVLLAAVAKVVNKLPNRVSIAGHTSASAGGAKPASDWALSSARADAARQLLQGAGVDPDRVYQVAGKASSDPLYPDDPLLPGNRRITIVLLREAPVLPIDTSP